MEFKYFKLEDFACKETGENKIKIEFVLKLDELRGRCGFPFIVTSGYRSPLHRVEVKKSKPGKHTEGIAADIRAVDGRHAYVIMKEAFAMGFKGIALGNGFVHIDDRHDDGKSWTY